MRYVIRHACSDGEIHRRFQIEEKIQGTADIVFIRYGRAPQHQHIAAFVAKVQAADQSAISIPQVEDRAHHFLERFAGEFREAHEEIHDLPEFTTHIIGDHIFWHKVAGDAQIDRRKLNARSRGRFDTKVGKASQ